MNELQGRDHDLRSSETIKMLFQCKRSWTAWFLTPNAACAAALMSLFWVGLAWSQSTPDDKSIEAAKREGGLLWYTAMAIDAAKPLADGFHKKYSKSELYSRRHGADDQPRDQ
jgi:hypothetical protein